jgi:hypothetical protein
MKKIINDFTAKFLTYSRVLLFILFAMESFNWYDSSDPIPSYVTIVVNLIGCISFLSWVYAIGHKANLRLQNQSINLIIFKYFNFGFIMIIGSLLTMFILSQGDVSYGDNSGIINYHITYTKPGEVAFILVAAFIFTISVASKALVSAEKNKEAEFGDYFVTILLFIFSWLGLWFIQPRVQKL